jgi:hypothetical protein
MRSRLGSAAIGLSVLSLFGLFRIAALSGASGPIELQVAGRRSATPTIAADGQFVAVAWGGQQASGTTDVFAAVSRDGGRAFGTPVRVNDVVGDAQLNGEQPPHIALVRRAGREPVLVVVWTSKGAKGTTLRQSRSDDGGRSFSAAALVPGTDAPGNRGWEAIAVGPAGRVVAIWLDHRELAHDMAMPASHHDHKSADKPDGVATAQKSKLFFASLDGAAAPQAVTGGVCYCCKTALVSRGDAVYAAWRHVYPGNLRDMAFTMSRDGGRTFAAPVRVSEDQWALEGCPDDGPAMAVDAENRIHVVWPTLIGGAASDPNIALFYAMSTDGRHFTARERIPTEGMPHHPRLVAGADGSLTAAWDELAGGSRHVAIGRGTVSQAGRPQFRRQLLTKAGAGVYPAIAATGDGVVTAWTSGESTSIHVLRGADAPATGTGR